MRINRVQLLQNHNVYNTRNIFDKQPDNQVNNTEKKNTDLIAYSKNYYLMPSFKGEQKNEQLQNFEDYLDRFYMANEGQDVQYLNTRIYDYYAPLSKSRLMNLEFYDTMDYLLKQKLTMPIDERRLTNTMQSTLNNIFGRIYHEPPSAKEFIKHLKQTKVLEEPISIDEDSPQLAKILDAADQELIQSQDDLDALQKRRLSVSFTRSFNNEIHRNTPQIFDERRYNMMKDALEQEPFLSFAKKLDRIEAQEKLNKDYTADECANDVYNDLLQKKITPFENPKIYSYVSKNDEKLDFLLEKLYGVEKPVISEIFDNSGFDKKHSVLLIDPALVNNFDKLVDYVQEQNIDTSEIEPAELRKRFSDYLGTETVYRGLYTENPQDLIEKLNRDGNFASAFQNRQKAVNAIKFFIDLDEDLDATIHEKILNKIHFSDKNSEFLSASSVYDVAASVPKLQGKPETPVVVIKTEVPKLSLIKQENLFHAMQLHQLHRVLHIGNRPLPYDRDMKKIEIFIPFYLPTNNAEISIDTTTPNLRWLDY